MLTLQQLGSSPARSRRRHIIYYMYELQMWPKDPFSEYFGVTTQGSSFSKKLTSDNKFFFPREFGNQLGLLVLHDLNMYHFKLENSRTNWDICPRGDLRKVLVILDS
jgi:hypothetical protein